MSGAAQPVTAGSIADAPDGAAALAALGAISIFGGGAVLPADLEDAADVARTADEPADGAWSLFDGPAAGARAAPVAPSSLRLAGGVTLRKAVPGAAAEEPTVGPALRALAVLAAKDHPRRGSEPGAVAVAGAAWLDGWSLRAGPAVRNLAAEQGARLAALHDAQQRDFANSAYYLGSKRRLGPFLSEALHCFAPDAEAVVDLMCGSGAASGAFSRHVPVVASDAQSFSLLLARVQGGGMTPDRAEGVLCEVLGRARPHLSDLQSLAADAIAAEQAWLHGPGDPQACLAAAAAFPTYRSDDPPGRTVRGWDPVALVAERRSDPAAYPYVLFLAYFANRFVGVRQATEIDSLRYAIDGLSGLEREWALGALVVSVSAVATTYAGHFAQPLVNDRSLSDRVFRQLLRKRPMSVIREFEARLRSLAASSADVRHPVTPVPGPWRDGLEASGAALGGRRPVVYLDPPYTREEYSRYYHVLETLADYRYPSAVGPGRVPGKGPGGRFASEFFTRSRSRMIASLAALIAEPLSRGWPVLWSYGSSAAVDATDVLGAVGPAARRVRSVSADHGYKSQGTGAARAVRESVLFIDP